jgi:hypothetical protein
MNLCFSCLMSYSIFFLGEGDRKPVVGSGLKLCGLNCLSTFNLRLGLDPD